MGANDNANTLASARVFYCPKSPRVGHEIIESVDLIAQEIELEPRKRGRPKGSTKAFARAQVWQSHGVGPLKANDVLLMIDERRQWRRLFKSEDDRIVLGALTFLVSMRDGRPAQQINLTSLNISISAEDIASARAIAAELRGGVSAPLMLLGDDGGKEDGDGGGEEGLIDQNQ